MESRNGLWLVDPAHSSTPITEVYEDRHPVILGSLPTAARAHVAETLDFLYTQTALATSPPRMLAAMLMALQAMGQRVDLMKVQAGGTFFGMRLSSGTVVAQDDLIYQLFRRAHFGPPEQAPDTPILLFAGIREGLLIAFSSLTGFHKVFVSHVTPLTDSEIDVLMKALFAEHHERFPFAAHFYGFVDRETGALVQVACPSGEPKRFLSTREGGLQITEELFRVLVSLPEVTDGTPPAVVPHLFLSEE